jgi:hypothetical protein
VLPLSGALWARAARRQRPDDSQSNAVTAAELQDVVSFYLGFRGSTYVIKGQAGIRWTGFCLREFLQQVALQILRTSKRTHVTPPMSCLELTQHALNLLASPTRWAVIPPSELPPFDGSFLRRRADGKAPRRR